MGDSSNLYSTLKLFQCHIPQADHVPADAYVEVPCDTIREHWRACAAEDYDLDPSCEPWGLVSIYHDMDRGENPPVRKWVTFFRVKDVSYRTRREHIFREKLDNHLGRAEDLFVLEFFL